MQSRRVGEVARERLRENGNRAAHQHRGRQDQQCREQHVEREADTAGLVRDREREPAHRAKQHREQPRAEANAALDRTVEQQQAGGFAARFGSLHHAPGHGAEQRVADRESTEEEREHRGSGFAVRAEQRRQVLLPGHFVDEATEARQHGEPERGGAHQAVHSNRPPTGSSRLVCRPPELCSLAGIVAQGRERDAAVLRRDPAAPPVSCAAAWLVARSGSSTNCFDAYPRRPDDPHDAHVEYEPEATLLALEAAIARLGHRAVRLGRPHDLLDAAAKGDVAIDAALCIAEGYGTRNREAWAPVLLEMLGVPQLGSDALTLSLSLDKAWTRAVVAAAGVPVAPGVRRAVARGSGKRRAAGWFPVLREAALGRNCEGHRARASRVDVAGALVAAVARVVSRYRQPALVEHFLAGAEYTVTVIGNDPPRALPVLQRALEAETRIGIHAVETPATSLAHVDSRRARRGARSRSSHALAIRAYDALDCRDFARADFKCDDAGRPIFLEINPLPTFAPDGSFGILAAADEPQRTKSCSPRCWRSASAVSASLMEWPRVAAPPGVAERDWRDWTWQMQHRVTQRRRARRVRRSQRRRAQRDRRARRTLPLRDHAVLRVADGPERSRVSDPPPGGAAPRGARRSGRPRRSARRGGALAGEERGARLRRSHRVLREQRMRALLPLLPAQAHGRRARVGDEEARVAGRTRLDPRDAGDPRRAADGRRPAGLLRRQARLAARRAARDPPRRADPARHAPAGDASLPRDGRALPPARAPSSDLGEHPLQPSEGTHRRGGRSRRQAHARGLPGGQPERAARAASTTTSRP